MSKQRALSVPFSGQVALAFAAIYIIWGSTYLGIRFAVETVPPFLMSGMRFIVAGGLLCAWAWLHGGARPTRQHWKAAALVGGLLFLGGNGGVTWSEQRISSSVTASLVATVPLWIVLLDWVRPGGVRPSRRVVAGLVIGFVGVVLLVGQQNGAGAESGDLLGALVVQLAAISWASGSLASRGAGLPSSATLSSGMQMLMGGVFLTALGALTGEWGRLDVAAISLRSLLAWLYLIFMGSILAFTAYAWLLRVSTPARVATYAYVNPVIAVFLGWWLGDEPLTPQTLLAAACIVGAVAVVTTYRARGSVVQQPVGDGQRAAAVAASVARDQ